ncbi:hypothetical protein PR048_017073 [Dryococelus australis]|uniref:Uncharacterized protein n=1 Tax=Dryococelus australis TaxID=614101 RepID=A0ABQ9H8I2_9NEOP|nr:hypothetical protein PR048_017073 [Dryococelus australis]
MRGIIGQQRLDEVHTVLHETINVCVRYHEENFFGNCNSHEALPTVFLGLRKKTVSLLPPFQLRLVVGHSREVSNGSCVLELVMPRLNAIGGTHRSAGGALWKARSISACRPTAMRVSHELSMSDWGSGERCTRALASLVVQGGAIIEQGTDRGPPGKAAMMATATCSFLPEYGGKRKRHPVPNQTLENRTRLLSTHQLRLPNWPVQPLQTKSTYVYPALKRGAYRTWSEGSCTAAGHCNTAALSRPLSESSCSHQRRQERPQGERRGREQSAAAPFLGRSPHADTAPAVFVLQGTADKAHFRTEIAFRFRRHDDSGKENNWTVFRHTSPQEPCGDKLWSYKGYIDTRYKSVVDATSGALNWRAVLSETSPVHRMLLDCVVVCVRKTVVSLCYVTANTVLTYMALLRHRIYEVSIAEKKRDDEEIRNISMVQHRQTEVSQSLIFAMLDGKVYNVLTQTTPRPRCYLCGATSEQVNIVEEIIPSDDDEYKNANSDDADDDANEGEDLMDVSNCGDDSEDKDVASDNADHGADEGDNLMDVSNWCVQRELFSSQCVYLRDFQRRSYYIIAGKSARRFIAPNAFTLGPCVSDYKLVCILICSPTKAIRVQSKVGSPDFRTRESCRTMPSVGGYSRGSPVSSALSFRCRSILTSITHVGSQDLTVKSCPNIFTICSMDMFGPLEFNPEGKSPVLPAEEGICFSPLRLIPELGLVEIGPAERRVEASLRGWAPKAEGVASAIATPINLAPRDAVGRATRRPGGGGGKRRDMPSNPRLLHAIHLPRPPKQRIIKTTPLAHPALQSLSAPRRPNTLFSPPCWLLRGGGRLGGSSRRGLGARQISQGGAPALTYVLHTFALSSSHACHNFRVMVLFPDAVAYNNIRTSFYPEAATAWIIRGGREGLTSLQTNVKPDPPSCKTRNCGGVVESCRTMPSFSGSPRRSPVSHRTSIPALLHYSPRFTLIGSRDLDARKNVYLLTTQKNAGAFPNIQEQCNTISGICISSLTGSAKKLTVSYLWFNIGIQRVGFGNEAEKEEWHNTPFSRTADRTDCIAAICASRHRVFSGWHLPPDDLRHRGGIRTILCVCYVSRDSRNCDVRRDKSVVIHVTCRVSRKRWEKKKKKRSVAILTSYGSRDGFGSNTNGVRTDCSAMSPEVRHVSCGEISWQQERAGAQMKGASRRDGCRQRECPPLAVRRPVIGAEPREISRGRISAEPPPRAARISGPHSRRAASCPMPTSVFHADVEYLVWLLCRMSRVIEVWSSAAMKGRGKREILEKTPRTCDIVRHDSPMRIS